MFPTRPQRNEKVHRACCVGIYCSGKIQVRTIRNKARSLPRTTNAAGLMGTDGEGKKVGHQRYEDLTACLPA